MNANEISYELDKFSELGGDVFFGMCADLVRQQQAEIEALEQSKDRLIKTLLDVRGQHPLAYINKYADGKELLDNGMDLTAEENIPLFTHPVKELTDEEIKQVWSGVKWNGSDPIELTFARAILRKAQAK